jgi:DNA gyrase subunit A
MDFPSSSGYGDPVQKLLKFKDGERIVEAFGIAVGDRNEQQQKQQELLFKPGKREFVFVTERGLGLRTSVEGFDGIKRNGKRVIKVRDGDNLVSISTPAKKIAFFSRSGYGLTIDQSEIQEREGASIGIQLFGVRPDDALVAAIPFDKGDRIVAVALASGGTKEIKLSEVVAGKRALKGNKVIARGEIVSARVTEGK